MENKEKNAKLLQVFGGSALVNLSGRIEKMTDKYTYDCRANLTKRLIEDIEKSPTEADYRIILDKALDSAVTVGSFLSEIQMSIVLHDMEYPMDDESEPSLIIEHSQIQTVLCPVHYLLLKCVEHAMSVMRQNTFTPDTIHDYMARRAPKSIRDCFCDLPFLIDVDPSSASFLDDTRIAVADVSWLLAATYGYISRIKKELDAGTLNDYAQLIVTIDFYLSEAKRRIEEFNEDDLINFGQGTAKAV